VSGPAADALVRLSALAGDRASLGEAARALECCPEAARAVVELREVADALAAAGLGDRVAIDLGEVRGLDYYTGLVFRVYARGLGFEVGGGGRYDALLARFGRPMPAVGFMLGLDRVALLLDRQQGLPADDAVAAEAIHGDGLGDALAHARSRRAAGARVRFGGATGDGR
jgi:ATP phosphoribosyltransferase regulatory subunit